MCANTFGGKKNSRHRATRFCTALWRKFRFCKEAVREHTMYVTDTDDAARLEFVHYAKQKP